MDGIVEMFVTKKITHDNYALRVVVILATILIPTTTLIYAILYQIAFVSLAFALFMLGGYLIYYTITSQKIEYEYTITNQNLIVDKVINKNKRVNVCDLTLNHITLFAHIDDKRLAKIKFAKKFDVSRNISDPDNYVACFNTPKYGDCCLIITPNAEALEFIGGNLPLEQRREFRDTLQEYKSRHNITD